MKIETIFKILRLGLTTPVEVVRKISFKKVIVLLKALKNEPSQQIITNFKRFLLGGDYNHSIENKIVDINSLKEKILQQKKEQFDEFIRSESLLIFPKEVPILSIILVFFNKAELSLACLLSILKNIRVSYEVIIVDNHSTDKTNLLLDIIKGATIIRNNKNLHFLNANNQALRYVKGEYLLFLNNDTEITKTTISSAIQTLTSCKKCGAVGGKLILPDGFLQEAGSIIWNDGSCLGYGRNKNPNYPEYNFKRVIDYCSGAFLLTKTNLFKEHGGFDKRFEPAYYEETDYCLWLQEKGLQVIYDPKAVVFHFEFGSGIVDSALDLHQKNQQIFYAKHQKQLENHHSPDLSNVSTARFSASQKEKRRVLYIDDRIPHCDYGSGFPRSNTIVRFMKELGYDLTIYPLNFPNEDNWETAYRDIDMFIEIAIGYGLDGFERFVRDRENYYDIIWVSRPHNMDAIGKYISLLKGNCKVIYDAEAIFSEREILKIELQGRIKTHEKKLNLFKQELSLSVYADTITTVSENDALKFKEFDNKDVYVLGHTLEIHEVYAGFHDRAGLLFVGNLDNNVSPNVDSVLWFIKEILPLIRKEIPDLTVDIVGSVNSSKIQKIDEKGVTIWGRIESIVEFYNKNKVFIAPTRFAAGIPFKIHEAASYGLPVVATQLLCNQLGWCHEKEIIAAKIDKFDFAHKVIELYHNEQLWRSIQNESINFIRNELSAKKYKQKIIQILEVRN